MHQSIMKYRDARYFKWMLVFTILSIAIFISYNNMHPVSGGTLQGYVLGTIGAILIVWLSLLGIVKRRYSGSNVQAWTSAHVYLGLSLIVIATLHSGMQFGLNVHSLAYVLMCLVIFSGVIGLIFYLRYPQQLAHNRAGTSRQRLFAELSELNDRGVAIANHCSVNVRTAVDSAVARTAIGGNLFDQLLGRDKSSVILVQKDEERNLKATGNTDQQAVIDYIAKCIPRARRAGEVGNLQTLLSIVCRRQEITRQLREDIKLQARLKIWLWVHIPATMGLLAALTIHIVAVFFYW